LILGNKPTSPNNKGLISKNNYFKNKTKHLSK
jgi:hypothetical protein